MTDQELQNEIEQALQVNTGICSERVKAYVEGGSVLLSGTVASGQRKAAVRDTVESLEGVGKVSGGLSVNPKASVSDRAAKVFVQSAHMSEGGFQFGDVLVEVKGGRCFLSGSVASEEQRIGAERLALSCKGVLKVKNLLLVNAGDRVSGD